MTELRFVWYNDEECVVYLDHAYLIELTHERMGWEGMEISQRMLGRIASSQGWTVVTEGDPG